MSLPSRVVLSPSDFFLLVDAVLTHEAVGRLPLDPAGPQRRIVTISPTDRVLQILAGPGSGKTEMLVWRILYELLVLGSPAEALLVTTFTRKAATELEVRLVERCDLLLEQAKQKGIAVDDPHVHDVRVGTLHSLCDALLREFDNEYMENGTRLIDDHETTVRMVREYRWKIGYWPPRQKPGVGNTICDTAEIAGLFRPPWETGAWPANDMERVDLLRAVIAQHAETWIPRCRDAQSRNGIEYASAATLGVTEAIDSAYKKWVTYLDDNALMDFSTIQQRFLERQHMVTAELRHVFVDEFQDTNPVQLAIHVGWLSGVNTRLTVVGDDDQSVYRFRGSDIACFQGLRDECMRRDLPFRLEKLEHNHRSTATIVAFSEAFRARSVLSTVSMPKDIQPAREADVGEPVRLLVGPWPVLCGVVAAELAAEQAAHVTGLTPDAAILMFSTSEKSGRSNIAPGLVMRDALEQRHLRVFNARNKTAGGPDSPVHDLLGLISYLIDPVRKVAVPGNKRQVEVHATAKEPDRRPHAEAAAPKFGSYTHAGYQKRFRKANGGSLDQPAADRAEIIQYVDELRTRLVDAGNAKTDRRRLTLSAFVARLMSFPYFRRTGYTVKLFRQALFTALLEANVAPTRRTMRNLDEPMRPSRTPEGKIEWQPEYWDLLRVMGAMLEATSLDDEEVEAFSENAVAMLTFHQAKGLEFEHIYVAATGRDVMPANVLRTALFSGNNVSYSIATGAAETNDPAMLQLAAADREREVYVALTRAKKRLTLLHDPSHGRTEIKQLNPGLAAVFADSSAEPHPLDPTVTVQYFPAATTGGAR